MPITPAPTTTIERGTCSRSRMLSESTIVALVELDAVRPGRPGAGGDDDLVGGDRLLVAGRRRRTATVCGVDEAAGAGEQGDVVAGQLAADDVDLPADHVLGAGGQVGDGDVVLDPVALAVQLALAEAGEVEHRLAQGLGRDGAGVDADPADHVAALDDGRPGCRAWPRRWPPSGRRGRSRSRAGRSRTRHPALQAAATSASRDRRAGGLRALFLSWPVELSWPGGGSPSTSDRSGNVTPTGPNSATARQSAEGRRYGGPVAPATRRGRVPTGRAEGDAGTRRGEQVTAAS